jgi:hypothetical protein
VSRLTEPEVEALIKSIRTNVTTLRAELMAHIRQSTKIRSGSASTRGATHTGSGVLSTGSATVSGSGTVVPASNNPPVWQTVPAIEFTQGTAANYSVAGLVSDADLDTLTITHNGATLPDGVTYDSANKRFSYNGSGAAGSTSGHQLTADDGADDTVVEFGLTSTSTGTKPFCFGHPFKRGDIPQGRDIVANIPEFQANVLNRWSDGSVKFALLSGRISLTADVTSYIDLKAGSASSGTALTEANLQALGPTASIQCGGFGTVTLGSLIGQTSTGRTVPGLVRTRISGPYMSEFHYYSPVGVDNHLAVWFFVRLFVGNHIEIETVVENGWLNVTGPTLKSYTPTLTINGSTRSLGVVSVSHYHHSRWGFPAWHGTDPAVTPKHDAAYLRSTGLVPRYGWTSPSSSAFTGITQTIVPFQVANLPTSPDSMGSGGYSDHIGLQPRWDALYCTSADSRAYNGCLANSYSLGRYSVHYRDEGTMRPLAFSSYPNLVVNQTGSGIDSLGASSTNTYTPAPSGAVSDTYVSSHHPSWGFLAYLITGRWSFMEEVQFCATLNYLKNTNTNRNQSQGVFLANAGANQARGAAWSIRTLAQALCVTPDGDTLQDEFKASLQYNIEYYRDNYVGSANNLGLIMQYTNYASGSGKTNWATWQDDFFTAVLGWAQDMGLPLDPSYVVKLSELMTWKCLSPVGRTGGQSPLQWCFRSAANYNIQVAPTEGFASIAAYNAGVHANWGAAYVANFGTNSDCSSGSALLGGNIDSDGMQESYWANFIPAIAAAVNHGASGASTGWARLSGASNWTSKTDGFNDNPTWGVVPRS